MLTYLKRKLKSLPQNAAIPFPHYYEENGILIKETEPNVRYEIRLDENHQEKLIRRISS